MIKLKKPRYNMKGKLIRFDERDNVHARHELKPDTPDWKEFYSLHPEWEEVDRINKTLPGVGMVGHVLPLPMLYSYRKILAYLGSEHMVDGPLHKSKQQIESGRATGKIKGFAKHLKADLVL